MLTDAREYAQCCDIGFQFRLNAEWPMNTIVIETIWSNDAPIDMNIDANFNQRRIIGAAEGIESCCVVLCCVVLCCGVL